MNKEYTIEQAISIRRMLHDSFMRGFAYGMANYPTEKELSEEADEEVEMVIEYENEHFNDE